MLGFADGDSRNFIKCMCHHILTRVVDYLADELCEISEQETLVCEYCFLRFFVEGYRVEFERVF